MRNSTTSRRRWGALWLATVFLSSTASALDPNRAITQYIHDSWGVEQGFPGGAVYAIAQTPDGYLWIGAEKGLVRFDGLNFRLFNHSNSPALPPGPVLGLTPDADGYLWIRMQSQEVLRFGGGIFQNALSDLVQQEKGVTAMSRGNGGAVLLFSRLNGTIRYSHGKSATIAANAGRPNFLILAMAESGDGTVWLGTRDAGLYSLSAGQPTNIAKGLPDRKINYLLPVGQHDLWVATDNGIVRWNGTALTGDGVAPAFGHVQTLAMTRDRQSNIWVGTDSGLYRSNADGVSKLERGSGKSSEPVTALLEDREGDLWVGSNRGVERLRDSVFMSYSASGRSGSESNGPIYVDQEGRTWFAPSDDGLYWLKGTHTEHITAAGLANDVVYSIDGGAGEVWAGRQYGGLTRLRYNGSQVKADTYTAADGLAQNSVYAVHRSRNGTVWAGTLSGGISSFKDGSFTTYTTASGLLSNTVSSIAESSDGTLWFATPNGLNALSEGRWRAYTGREGLPPGSVNCLFVDPGGVLWIGTSDGLAFLNGGHIKIVQEAPDPLREPILGIAEDKNGWLWIATASHVARVNRDKIVHESLVDEDVREYGLADGLPGLQGVKRHRSVVSDSLGRIWFSLNPGISVADPARITGTEVPAIVHISSISADGSTLDLRGPLRIPAARKRVAFSFAGLSLSVPDRVRFRYKLDNLDPGWSDPVAARETSYTNLSPGSYRFRVIASNADGVWNSQEAAMGFTVDPAFWQTWWFQLSVMLACASIIAGFYRFRLHRLTQQMNIRFEERLGERTRIAQELHDTLLQGFLSASMQLHVAVDALDAESPVKAKLSRVLRLMQQVVDEGRNAVQGLRSPRSGSLDLEQAFSCVREEFSAQEGVNFRVIVSGQRRALHPVLRDEAYRIGREALVNAFRHSGAKNIEIEIEYQAGQLRVIVRDDGAGIDPRVLESGREGHWGLPVMRERAERIGARLHVFSAPAAGTEVELSVPSHVAFQDESSGGLFNWFGLRHRRASDRGQPAPKHKGES